MGRKLFEFELVQGIKSPSVKLDKQGNLRWRFFDEGNRVSGYMKMGEEVNGLNIVPQIIAFEEWRIPATHVKKIRDLGFSTNDILSPSSMDEETKKQVRDIAHGNFVGGLKTRNEMVVKGGFAGIIAGVGYAFMTKKGIISCAIIGGLLGGIAGQVFFKQDKLTAK